MNKFEAVDAEGGEVATLLRALPRADAPGNFEFRVKARIAEGATPRTVLVPFFRLAAPLCLILAVVGFGVFYNALPTQDQVAVADASDGNEQPVIESAREASVPAELASNTVEPKIVEPQRASVETIPVPVERNNLPVRVASNSRSTAKRPTRSVGQPVGGGSRVEALGSARIINAPGIGGEIPVRDVFQGLGITANFAGGSWKVKSATDRSIAHRSGIQPGDVIEAIDGKGLTESTSFKEGFNGKVFRVRRDGKTINLDLKN